MAKKKRRPSGRRPRREKSPSAIRQLTNVAKAALAVGTGVALFNNSQFGRTLKREIIPTISKTIKNYSDELAGTRRKGIDMYNAYQKAIGKNGEAVKETLKQVRRSNANPKYKPRVARERSLFGFSHNLEQMTKGGKGFKEIDRNSIDILEQKAINELTAKYGDKYDPNVIKKIVKSTVRKRNQLEADKDLGTKFLEKTLEKNKVDLDDAKKIMKETLDTLGGSSDVVQSVNRRSAQPLMDEIRKQRLKLKKADTRENLLLNKIGKKLGINDLESKLLGSKAMTLGELLENEDILDVDDVEDLSKTIRDILDDKDIKINSLNDLKRLVADDDSWNDVIVDRNLRIRKAVDGTSEIFDNSEFAKVMEDFMDKFNATLPGKVLTKGIDLKNIKHAPDIVFFHQGDKSILSQFDKDAKNNELSSMKVGLRSGLFKHTIYDVVRDANDELHLGEALGEGYVVKMDRGTLPRIIKNFLGSDAVNNLSSDNRIMQALDINQDGRPNLFKRFTQRFTKFADDDWERNILNRVQETIISGRTVVEEIEHLQQTLGLNQKEAMIRLYEDSQVVNELYAKLISKNAVEKDTIVKLLNAVTDENFVGSSAGSTDKVTDILNLILNDNVEDVLDHLAKNTDYDITTAGLTNLIREYKDNTAEVLKRTSIHSSTSTKIPIMDMELSETNVEFIEGEVRLALLKELMSENKTMVNALADIDINQQQLRSISLITQWRNYEVATAGVHEFNKKTLSLYGEAGAYDRYLRVVGEDDAYKAEVVRTFEEMKSEFGVFHKGVEGNPNESYYSEYGTYDFIPTTNLSLSKSILENVNSLIKELNGGRDNLDQISPVTMVAQYMVSRLSYGVDDQGLGLSHKSLTSPLNSIKNIALKRVLPVMAAYTAFDYLNDLSQDVTGTGITGAMANTARNLDLMGRGIAYHTGLGQALDWLKQTSVIGEYWTGSNDFQTVEERKDWYENGYSPVRKSRFWSFGSASEFRGGDVTFFQPNYWKRAHSDYYDKWLYGGNKEKWAHSFIPTPTHPLSTIRYLMDPYWLEKKHMDDAPTPLTGKMFSEGTPWGAVLNPTVGQVIKPVRMLPEVRKRLTGKGHDSRAIVQRINERIKTKKDRREKGASNKDIIVVNGTDIRNATYIPYGNPTANELIITNGRAKGLNYVEKLSDIDSYQVPTYDPSASAGGEYGGSFYGGSGSGGGGGYQQASTAPPSKAARTLSKGIDSLGAEISRTNNGLGQGIIQGINNAIKEADGFKGVRNILRSEGNRGPVYSSSPDSSNEGTYIYNNLVNEYNTYTANYYDDKFMPGFLDDGFGSQTRDYMRDMGYSAKQLSGIYGFLKDVVRPPETTYRWENAGSYQSFSSRFWDAGVGGLGGGVMEIARRFFPSSDKSRVDYNPLRNNVADWLPDYLQVGNPFSKLTKGAMRLPGKGYESLNELHPDEYATDGYGAFDRFKILADVAPNSKEYKIWHNIVKHQTLKTNPGLREEVEEIESRTKRMRGSHEFYDYQYLHTNTKYETGIVKKVTEDGKVILGNNQVLSLAGIKFNENYGGELNSILEPGKKITYRTTEDVVHDEDNNPVRSAAIYADTQNVNRQLMDMGVADRDKSDTSSIGQLATVSAGQEVIGAIQELIAHARIPIVHNKLMHIETALESFKSEQMYGANFQTWDHPIETVVKPMMNEAMGQSMLRRAAAVAYSKFHFNTVLTSRVGGIRKFASGAVLATLDPAAMLGGSINWALRLNNGRVGKGDKPLGAFSSGARIGSAIGTVAWGWANADNPLKATASFSLAAMDIFKELELGDLLLEKFGKTVDIKKAGVIGAIAGLTVSALKNPDFNWDRMTEKWQPKKFKKINEINEYYDRLEYIKYSGLYEDAARKAALIEGSNIKDILKDIDKNKARIAKLKEKQRKLLSKHNENSARYKAEKAKLQEEIDALTQRGNQMFTGGKYTKAAIAYKRAMESTVYGLQSTATQDEILAAVPDQYKDYFQKFMEETDEGERKKILKHLPDYLKRPLQAAWGEKMEDVQSNTRYFRSHKLPTIGWRGWKPNVNLKHVKMKTIENEGMLLSDFGYYESEKAKPQYMMAPEIDNYDRGGGFGISIYTRLASEMRGAGVMLSNVSLEQTSAPGLWITSDIKQSISDRHELATNTMTNAIQGIVANFI